MTRPPVEARRAIVDDLDDLVLLWSQAREELGKTSRLPSAAPLEQFRARLVDALSGQDSIILIGRYEGAAAGYAVLRLAPVLLVDGDSLHVEQLFVLPSLRRRGVARALLVAATAIAERHGAEQVLAGAPPSARESHRFLARLGFSPLVIRRVVGTAALRRRLAGEGQRRGLEDLLSRRRSLRARSLRAGWVGRSGAPQTADDDDLSRFAVDGDLPADPGRAAGGEDVRHEDVGPDTVPVPPGSVATPVIALDDPQHIDLVQLAGQGSPDAEAAEPGADVAEPDADAAEPDADADAAQPDASAAEPGTSAAEPGTSAAPPRRRGRQRA